MNNQKGIKLNNRKFKIVVEINNYIERYEYKNKNNIKNNEIIDQCSINLLFLSRDNLFN